MRSLIGLAHGRGGPGGPPTIHNYFPDGAIFSDALIDTLGQQDYDVHCWQGQMGTETLAFSAGGGPGSDNAIAVTLAGNGTGVFARDWSNAYGCKLIPAGRHYVGMTLTCDIPGTVVQVGATASSSSTETDVPVTLSATPQRVVIPIDTVSIGGIGPSIYTLSNEDPPVTATIFISSVMVTEDADAAFADGDTAGWSWAGTPHASISSGPKPA